MVNKKVLITVKTYPTISTKYDELVCTAGFLEDGTWIRIYPIPFRKKSYNEQYKKYDWIELDLVKNESDFRPESFRPKTLDTEIKIVGHLDTKNNWAERKKYCLNNVYTNLSCLIAELKTKAYAGPWPYLNQPKYLVFILSLLNVSGVISKKQH